VTLLEFDVKGNASRAVRYERVAGEFHATEVE
jgi:hypothetical protein